VNQQAVAPLRVSRPHERRGDEPVRRLWVKIVRAVSRRGSKVSPSTHEHKLTAAEYEAVILIAYEGRSAHARACEQAVYCRQRGSEQRFRFWSQVAHEVRLRTRGRLPEKP
jgi:hypothetical protein